jgi:hypothetical protein
VPWVSSTSIDPEQRAEWDAADARRAATAAAERAATERAAANAAKIESARLAYVALCEAIGSDSVTEETAILSAGREFLPPCALAVLDDRAAVSVEYYAFLTEQTEKAQAEHDRETAAGRGWHGGVTA